jgi:hypothetical protein
VIRQASVAGKLKGRNSRLYTLGLSVSSIRIRHKFASWGGLSGFANAYRPTTDYRMP